MHCKGNRSSGGVAGIDNIPSDSHMLGQSQLLHHLVNDSDVRLVRDEGNEVLCSDSGGVERQLRH